MKFAGQITAAVALATVAFPAALLAQSDTGASKRKSDPNTVICEKQEVLGSRLATKRVCLTRAEWTERRRLERMDLDRTQTQRGTAGDGR